MTELSVGFRPLPDSTPIRRIALKSSYLVPGEKRAEGMRDMTLRQDAQLIESAFELRAAGRVVGTALKRFHANVGRVQIAPPVNRWRLRPIQS